MFADDIVICNESRERVKENLERWRYELERRGMKVSCNKTEYMWVNNREVLKYLGQLFRATASLEKRR